jgi:hypothetical protein
MVCNMEEKTKKKKLVPYCVMMDEEDLKELKRQADCHGIPAGIVARRILTLAIRGKKSTLENMREIR